MLAVLTVEVLACRVLCVRLVSKSDKWLDTLLGLEARPFPLHFLFRRGLLRDLPEIRQGRVEEVVEDFRHQPELLLKARKGLGGVGLPVVEWLEPVPVVVLDEAGAL